MRFHQTTARNGKQLHRLATLLSALADLAERAASRSRAVCLLVIWLIGPAESGRPRLCRSNRAGRGPLAGAGSASRRRSRGPSPGAGSSLACRHPRRIGK